jgi:hypothetical protein
MQLIWRKHNIPNIPNPEIAISMGWDVMLNDILLEEHLMKTGN